MPKGRSTREPAAERIFDACLPLGAGWWKSFANINWWEPGNAAGYWRSARNGGIDCPPSIPSIICPPGRTTLDPLLARGSNLASSGNGAAGLYFNVSHELHTPSLKAPTETLRDGALEDPRLFWFWRMETKGCLTQMAQELLNCL
jgi:hypothetical protein